MYLKFNIHQRFCIGGSKGVQMFVVILSVQRAYIIATCYF
jgi:hypothetical protein